MVKSFCPFDKTIVHKHLSDNNSFLMLFFYRVNNLFLLPKSIVTATKAIMKKKQ